MRYSNQREVITQVVMNSYDHPTAEMVLSRAKEIMPSINMATVYRNLLLLVKEKKINRISIPTGDRFDHINMPHAHFYCSKCQKVFDIDTESMSEAINSIHQNLNMRIEKIDIVFTGTCQNC